MSVIFLIILNINLIILLNFWILILKLIYHTELLTIKTEFYLYNCSYNISKKSLCFVYLIRCKLGGSCEMDTYTRRKCPDCRLKKCRSVGMLEECLLTEIQCQSKRRRKKTSKDEANKRNGDSSPENGASVDSIFYESEVPKKSLFF